MYGCHNAGKLKNLKTVYFRNMILNRLIACFLLLSQIPIYVTGQDATLDSYNIVWNSPSKNSSESMPCGGGDVGLNVWVEEGDILFYMSKSGTFDENNTLLKLGRMRVRLSPNPFAGKQFRQELVLKEGHIKITGTNGDVTGTATIWVDVSNPVIHFMVNCNKPVKATAGYESWRYKDRPVTGSQNNANSYKWAPPAPVITRQDTVTFTGNNILFYHRNRDITVFDVTVHQQGMDSVKKEMYNPLRQLAFGGYIQGSGMEPAGTYTGTYWDTDYKGWKLQTKKSSRSHGMLIFLHKAQAASEAAWREELETAYEVNYIMLKEAGKRNRSWWKQYWQNSFIYINPGKSDTSAYGQAARNYQLFRYMLGCNAKGDHPTKFNGGLFTYDPRFTDTTIKGTPDHRNWGGGTHTAQNQRLVYWPMLKSGDFNLMEPQFQFYLNMLRNAELRSKVYWNHDGACFTEQIENFGLPNCTEYGWKRPAGYDQGMEYNAWLEYEWDTVLEFCLMILETERYAGKDISVYMPLIESCLTFFNEHYQYLAKQRGSKALDGNKQLVLYPGSAAETYKMTYNASSTIAALRTVTTRLLELPAQYLTEQKRKDWELFLSRIPPISFRRIDGYTTIAPARLWERINNSECPQLYPVFPWGIYGIGKPGLDTAINTFKHDTDAIRFRSHIGWKQDNIFAARLGLTEEAVALTMKKLQNSGRRFPAFWGPGFDWTPDHNWGGSGMIGLQEMLLQTDGKKIYLLPAWPKNLDVHFKLHAPYNTTVEAIVKNGVVQSLTVLPAERKADVISKF
jgi:hypothetical protein